MNEWKPTATLRFVEREVKREKIQNAPEIWSMSTVRILQQWFAPDVPAYMVDPTQGEWRDIVIEKET
jgi:hypothetical protein